MTEGRESYLLNRGRSGMARDCGTNAYWRTYDDESGTANESAYSSANETNGTNENPPATRGRTQSPPSPCGDYGDPHPCAAHRV